MSKTEKPAKKTQPKTVNISYAVLVTKTPGAAIKTLVEDDKAGKQLLQDVYVSMTQGKPYFNEDHAIVLNPDNFSHGFLVREKVGV